MARTKRSAHLDSRNKRLVLAVGVRHMDLVQAGTYLLYRRPRKGSSGTWTARAYNPATRKQENHKIGQADDFADADGLTTFTYGQAVAKAMAWFTTCTRLARLAEGGEVPPVGPYTVGDAIRDYLEAARRRGMKGLQITELTANAHILPKLGTIPVVKLSRRKIETWHVELAETPRKSGAKRPGPSEDEGPDGETGSSRPEPPPPAVSGEALRKRKNTANRILTILKAALNHAVAMKTVMEPTPWRDVKPFKEVAAARVRFLTVDEQGRLVAACEPEFQALVQAALFTGGRYGELCRLRVQDFNPGSGTLFIETSKSWKSRHIFLTDEAQAWFAQHTAGRGSHEYLLTQHAARRTKRKGIAEGTGWAPYDEVGRMRKACKAAGLGHLTFHGLRHTYASGLVNRGVPLAYVAAQLGNADTRMVEKYYGHLCPNAQAESVRAHAPVLGIGQTKVQPLRTVAG